MIEIFITYLTLALAVILFIGVYGYKVSKKTMLDYMLAGGTIGTVAGYFWIAFAIYSAWTFFGFAGYLYVSGPAYHLYPFVAHLGFAIAIWAIGRRLLVCREHYKMLSPAEVLGKRYNSESFRIFAAVIWLIFIVPYIGLQVTAISAALQTFGGLPYWAGVVIMTAYLLILALLGGMRSVAWANIFWGTLMMVAFVGSLLWAINVLGVGLPEMSLKIYSEDPTKLGLGYYSPLFAMGLAIAGLTTFCWPHVLIATMGMKSPEVLKKVTVIWLIVGGFIVYLAAYLWGNLVAPYAVPGLKGKAADVAVLLTIQKLMPLWWVFFVLLGVLAAAISTIGTQLITSSLFASNDLIGRFKQLSEKSALLYARIIVIIVIIASIVFAALYPIEIARMLSDIASPGYSLMTAALIGLFWKRGTREGVWIGTLVGLILLILGSFYPPIYLGTHPVVVPLVVSLVLYFVISLITPSPPKEVQDIYFEKMDEYLKK